MALTDAGICNIALRRVGERQTITSLSDGSAQAAVLTDLYATARDELLVMFPWSWATAYASLTQSVVTVGPPTWAYVYAEPTTDIYGNARTVLDTRYLWAGTRTPNADSRFAYRWESPYIYTDQQPASATLTLNGTVNTVVLPFLVYTFTPLPAAWSVKFADALAWRLAVDLALAWTVKPQVAQMIERKFQSALNDAIAWDMNNGQEDGDPSSQFILARS